MTKPVICGKESTVCGCGKPAEFRIWRMVHSDVICIRPLWPDEPLLPDKFVCESCLPGAVLDFVKFVAMS